MNTLIRMGTVGSSALGSGDPLDSCRVLPALTERVEPHVWREPEGVTLRLELEPSSVTVGSPVWIPNADPELHVWPEVVGGQDTAGSTAAKMSQPSLRVGPLVEQFLAAWRGNVLNRGPGDKVCGDGWKVRVRRRPPV